MTVNTQTMDKVNMEKNEMESVAATQTEVSQAPEENTDANLVKGDEAKELIKTPRPASSKRARTSESKNVSCSQPSSSDRFMKSCPKCHVIRSSLNHETAN